MKKNRKNNIRSVSWQSVFLKERKIKNEKQIVRNKIKNIQFTIKTIRKKSTFMSSF